MSSVTCKRPYVNFTHRIGFCMSVLFRKIDFGGSISWKDTTLLSCVFDDRRPVGPLFQLVTGVTFLYQRVAMIDSEIGHGSQQVVTCFHARSLFFNIATVLLSSFFFGLFSQAVHQPDDVQMSTFHQICNRSWSCRTSILEGATFYRMN